MEASKTGPPTISSTMSTPRPSLASRSRSLRRSGEPSSATSAPRSSASWRLPSVDAVAITRPAPQRFASCTSSDPTPPAAAWTTTVSPSAIRVLVRSRCHAVRPCETRARAWPSVVPSGMSKVRLSGARARSAYPPSPTSATTRRPSAVRPATSAPGHVDQRLTRCRPWVRQLGQLQHLGTAEHGYLNRTHRNSFTRCRWVSAGDVSADRFGVEIVKDAGVFVGDDVAFDLQRRGQFPRPHGQGVIEDGELLDLCDLGVAGVRSADGGLDEPIYRWTSGERTWLGGQSVFVGPR